MATRGPDPTNKTDEIVATLSEYERPFMGTGELADQLGYDSNPGVTKHLKRAVDQNRIKQTTISGYNVWYLPGLVPESQIQGTTGPATGGNGGGSTPDKELDTQSMDLPGVLILALLGWTAGWGVYRSLLLAKRGRDKVVGENGLIDTANGAVSVDKGVLYLFATATATFVSVGGIAIAVLRAVELIGSGFTGAAIGYLVGVAVVVAALLRYGFKTRQRHADTNSESVTGGESA